MPIAAIAKIVAAVVSPVTLPRSRKITPAPKNPIPCTIFDAIRVVLASPVRLAISTETIVKSAAPRETQKPVRIPEGRLRILRSRPMMEPSRAAHARRATIVPRGSIFSCVPRLRQDSTHYSLNCVNFAKWRALACISLRFKTRSRSKPNFSTVKLPRTEPYTIARRSVASLKSFAPAR